MKQRFFTVTAKGLKGKDRKPFVTLESDEGDRLFLVLESRAELAEWEIDQELPVVVGSGKSNQTKLGEAKA